jgi:hypothetical protein
LKISVREAARGEEEEMEEEEEEEEEEDDEEAVDWLPIKARCTM